MRITILTLFPDMFTGPFSESIIKRSQEKGSVEIQLVNIRDFGLGTHKVVDDKPYGGGVGMVMKVDVLDKAIKSVRDKTLHSHQQKVVLLDPRGKQFKQQTAQDFSTLQHIILLCGHYEGIDERVRNLVDVTISIGDFILTGGEIPAMLVTDAVVRLIPGVLKENATLHESFSIEGFLLEYPHYTTPSEYKGEKVPTILLSGDHKKIDAWRQEQSMQITKTYRPDLLKKSSENS